jgi:hypothetical protein
MKRPETEAEWEAFHDAEDQALAAARTKDEYWSVFREQMRVRRELDDGTRIDAFEALDEIGREIAELRARKDLASGAG